MISCLDHSLTLLVLFRTTVQTLSFPSEPSANDLSATYFNNTRIGSPPSKPIHSTFHNFSKQYNETSSSSSSRGRRLSQKRGLIMNKQVVQSSADFFSNHASWFYNYMQSPLDWQGDWADAHDIEFVPMIPQPWLNHENGTKKCVFHSFSDPSLPWNNWKKLNICTLENVIDTLAKAKADRSKSRVGIKYLIGFNEMYNNPPPIGKDLKPEEAAYYWRIYVQPAAVANELDLVSPTVGKTKKAIRWFAKFLKQCYGKRNDQEYPCDINLIKKFALHHYDCKEQRWETWFGGDESKLMKKLTAELGTYGGKNDWDVYVRSRDIWVTETNCYWENNKKGYAKPSSKEQCLRITGQKSSTHGMGSLAKMEELNNIERYSWWTMWNEELKPNYLAYFDGQISPIGRAYTNPGDSSVNCEYLNGEQMEITDAIISDHAEILTCQATGTTMAR